MAKNCTCNLVDCLTTESEVMNRLSRDEIIHTALDMADLPTLNMKDRPEGILLPNAISIQWLQQAMDAFHKRYPFAVDAVTVDMLYIANSDRLVLVEDNTKNLPDDFTLDLRDGILLQPGPEQIVGRLRQRSLQSFINLNLQFQHHRGQYPVAYCVMGDDHIKVGPISDISYLMTMWYYKQPAKLRAEEKPKGFDEWCLIEYVRLRSLEWIRLLPPNTAKDYLNKELANLKAIGMLNNTEYEKLPLQNIVFLDAMLGTSSSPFAWMGAWV